MNKNELNNLAVAAKTDDMAVWEIKAHYMSYIESLQEENWYKMNNETSFIEDCYRKLEYAIRTYVPNKGDFDNRAKTLIYQSLKEYCGRRGNRRNGLFSLDKEVPGEEETKDYMYDAVLHDETVDVEAQVIEEVTKRELLIKYAASEMDRLIVEIILEANDLINQSEITRRLAARTGRTFNSARGVVRTFCARKQQGGALV